MPTIDLNADLGEHGDSFLDEQIMPNLSSCNIACGGHAGDERSIRKTVRLAKQHEVAIGAHPSYPDRVNFGRLIVDIEQAALVESLTEQISRVERICIEEEATLHHVKPHGALYNQAAKSPEISKLICTLMEHFGGDLKLYGLAHSITQEVAARHGRSFVAEAFADRRYEPDGQLRSRQLEGSVLSSSSEVLKQVEELVLRRRAYADAWISVEAQTICLHGDTKGAVTLAKEIRQHLVSKRIHIAKI